MHTSSSLAEHTSSHLPRQVNETLAKFVHWQNAADAKDDETRLLTTESGANLRAWVRMQVIKRDLQRVAWPRIRAARNPDPTAVAFIEALCSTVAEGMELSPTVAMWAVLDDARKIVAESQMADVDDLENLLLVIQDTVGDMQPAQSSQQFEQQLLRFHRRAFQHRPDIKPGQLKDVEVRVGGMLFSLRTVPPKQVKATIKAGWELAQTVPAGWQRSRMIEYLIAEVHPFRDGNGRMSRALANIELSAAGEQRMILPPRWMGKYIDGLRGIQRSNRPRRWLRLCQRMHQVSATVPWHDAEDALANLRARRMILDLPKMSPSKQRQMRARMYESNYVKRKREQRRCGD